MVKRDHLIKGGVDYRWLAPFSSPFVYRQFAQFSGVTASPGGALSDNPGTLQRTPRAKDRPPARGSDTNVQ
jgi:hypothetical protein